MYLHVYAKMQRNHSCTSKMRKTPHFGQFSNGTLLFLFMRIETRSNQGKLQNRWFGLSFVTGYFTGLSGTFAAASLMRVHYAHETLLAYALKYYMDFDFKLSSIDNLQ